MYKMKWAELPDSKKLKYINKAVEAKTKYDVSRVYFTEPFLVGEFYLLRSLPLNEGT